METTKLQAGNVVMVAATFGGQTKIRPAIVIEVKQKGVYLVLGSTKNLVNDRHSFVVNEVEEMRRMGLKYHTRFGFGNEADQWVGKEQICSVVGYVTQKAAQKLGQAWANSKFVRAQ